MNVYRSHLCLDVGLKDVGEEIVLSGWVSSLRNHGGLIFVMLRDHSGLVQCVTSDGLPEKHFKTIEALREEFVITISGRVAKRSADTINDKIPTGKIEVIIHQVVVINACSTLPFKVNEESFVADDSIKYRYLFLRREKAKNFIHKRYLVTHVVRNFLHEKGFIEIETPILTKTTPEGARDFLVPSRVYPGEFYALPQSPQQYKQLLMVAGVNRYFQIARALRDEDSRADRQAEHTQIDMELSFVERDEIIDLLEEMIETICEKIFDPERIEFKPFARLSYQDAMSQYGSDKPDLRFSLTINDLSDVFLRSEFKVFRRSLADGGKIKGIKWTCPKELSRSELDGLIELAQECGMAGLVWLYHIKGEWKSSIKKYISTEEVNKLKERLKVKENELILLGSGREEELLEAMGLLRVKIANEYDLIDESKLAFAFVVDYPLFKWNEKEKRCDPMHHMFVLPKKEDLPLLDSKPLEVKSSQFDLVCNGYELCSGSLRIYQSELQRKIMKLIGLEEEEIDLKFSHLLKAFDFGAPPHGGAAPGLDRLIMVLMKTTNIRDVIAFPKTQKGQDLMMNSPSVASSQQLSDLGLKLDSSKIDKIRLEYLQNQVSFDEKIF